MLIRYPVCNEGLDVVRQVAQGRGSLLTCEVPKMNQEGNSSPNRASGVATVRQPSYVPFDRFSNPRGLNAIDGTGEREIAIEHDNLLSKNNLRARRSS
jgi:hypothetical protein